jgi:hypothetical protein
VSNQFYYFGQDRNNARIPNNLQGVIQDRQGIKRITGELAENFIDWLKNKYGETKYFTPPSGSVLPMDFHHEGLIGTGPFLTGLVAKWQDDGPRQLGIAVRQTCCGEFRSEEQMSHVSINRKRT